ncbi:accessory factor UbiK family protein [Xanthobacter oligotrophicus]|uniref:Accessory factor UbiK family protein n=1 Tax=Xanthobacter oligotrophicus TaxID=2607286 RepID=A0ABW7A1D9_9HYPH
MTQTTGRIFDEMARLVNDAAGVAQGVRREAETAMKAQMERFLRDMDLVKREEFDAVKDLAAAARAESESLAARVLRLEAALLAHTHPTPAGHSGPPAPADSTVSGNPA